MTDAQKPDLIEEADAIFRKPEHPTDGRFPVVIPFDAYDREALGLAISSERDLRAECVRVLKELEWADHDGCGFDRSCVFCQKFEPRKSCDNGHAPDCALSALLRRLEAKP